MKQQVNFYTDQFKPKKDLLTFENMLLVWLAGIVFVLALYNFEYEKSQMANKNLLMTQQREQHQADRRRQLQHMEIQPGQHRGQREHVSQDFELKHSRPPADDSNIRECG